MLVEKSFDTGEVVLNYAEGPDNGPPIIFLHSFGEFWKGFIPLLPPISQRYHAHAVDLRGHGKSGRKPGQYNLKDYLSDIKAFALNKIKKPTFIFGHSMGGMIALMMAAYHPDSVKGLIIGDSPLSPFRPSKELRGWFEHVKDIATTGDSVMESYQRRRNESHTPEKFGGGKDPVYDLYNLATWSSLDPETCTPWIDASESNDVFDSLFEGYDSSIFSRIVCPVLYFQSINDADSLQSLPNVIIKKVDLPHDLHLIRPEPILRDVIYFLESLR